MIYGEFPDGTLSAALDYLSAAGIIVAEVSPKKIYPHRWDELEADAAFVFIDDIAFDIVWIHKLTK